MQLYAFPNLQSAVNEGAGVRGRFAANFVMQQVSEPMAALQVCEVGLLDRKLI